MNADEIASIIASAAQKHSVPVDALMAIANLESSGNINAANPRSSASGLFQFVDSTAREYGLTGSRRNDPRAQAEAAAKMMATNARSLERTLGRPANAGELYLAHQQGLTGARALLTNPNRPAVDVLTDVYGSRDRARQAVALNGGNLNQSAGQFAGQWVNKANQRAALIPPGEIPNTVASLTDTVPPRPVAPVVPETIPADLGALRSIIGAPQTRPDQAFMDSIYGPTMPEPMNAEVALGRALGEGVRTAPGDDFYTTVLPQVDNSGRNMVFGSGFTDTFDRAANEAGQNADLMASLERMIAGKRAVPFQSGQGQSYAGTERSTMVPRTIPPMPTNVAQSYAGEERGPVKRSVPFQQGTRQSFAGTETSTMTPRRAAPMPTGVAQSYAGQDTARRAIDWASLPKPSASDTVATVPTFARLPELPPSSIVSPNLFDRTLERAAEAQRSDPQRAVDIARARQVPPEMATGVAQSYAGQDRGPRSIADVPRPVARPTTASDLARMPYSAGSKVAEVPTVSLPSGVGQAPATRVVPSVSVPSLPKTAMGFDTDLGAMPTLAGFNAEFGLANPRETVAQPFQGPNVPGPGATQKGNERLMAGLPQAPKPLGPEMPDVAVASELSVVPSIMPPPPRPRPEKAVPTVPSVAAAKAPRTEQPNPIGEWFETTPIGRIGNALTGKEQAPRTGSDLLGAILGAQLSETANDPMTWATRMAFNPRLNIGKQPTVMVMPGYHNAVAVNRGGTTPVTMLSNQSWGSVYDDGSNPAGMNRDVYRANAAVLGGNGFNQSNIDKALASGATLFKPA